MINFDRYFRLLLQIIIVINLKTFLIFSNNLQILVCTYYMYQWQSKNTLLFFNSDQIIQTYMFEMVQVIYIYLNS